MNLILLDAAEIQNQTVTLNDRRFRHIRDIHRAEVNDELRIGVINRQMGIARVSEITDSHTVLEIKSLQEAAPLAPAIQVLIALPRPKVVPRIVQTAVSLGIKEIVFFNAARVEKVYWDCTQLESLALNSAAMLGLEQAGDTVMPMIRLQRLFKPWVEDDLPALIKGRRALVAHPNAQSDCPRALKDPIVLAIGPEGGFIPYEVEKLTSIGFTSVSIGQRTLKVETALTALVSRLF